MDQVKQLPKWLWIFVPLIASLILTPLPLPVRVLSSFDNAAHALAKSRSDLAVPYIHTITAYFPWRYDLLEQAGLAEIEAGQYAAAVQDLSMVQAAGKLSLAGKASLAKSYQETGQLTDALQTWNELRQAGYPADDFYPAVIALFRQRQDDDGLRSALDAWRLASPENAQAWFQSGLFYLSETPWTGLDMLINAQVLDIQLDSQVRMVQIQLGAAFGKDEPAYELVLAGRSLANLGEWVLAERALRQALLINPGYAEAWAYLGEVQEQRGADGLPALKRAMQESPTSPLVNAMLGFYWSRRVETDQALSYLQQAALLDPLNGVWWVEIGNLEAASGDLVTAAAFYQKALDVEPQNPNYWKALARFSLSVEYNIPLIGLPAARKAVLLAANDAEAQMLLGQALASQGDAHSAERAYLKALEIEPHNAQVYLLLGQLYFASDRNNDARSSFLLASQYSTDEKISEQAQRWLLYLTP